MSANIFSHFSYLILVPFMPRKVDGQLSFFFCFVQESGFGKTVGGNQYKNNVYDVS